MGAGLQFAIWILLWATAPDLPAKQTGLNYFGILGTMLKFAVTEPILIFGGLMSLNGSVLFVSTLARSRLLLTLLRRTFGSRSLSFSAPSRINIQRYKLGSSGTHASCHATFADSAKSLVGVVGICCAPFTGRLIDRLVPNVGVAFGQTCLIIGQTVMLGAGSVSVAAVIICIICIDLGQQLSQVSNSSNIYGIDPNIRARCNAIYILFV